jgi:hypothetical protein
MKRKTKTANVKTPRTIELIKWCICTTGELKTTMTNHVQVEGNEKTICGIVLKGQTDAVKGHSDKAALCARCQHGAEELRWKIQRELEKWNTWNGITTP